jgi:hypothetical protein
MPVDHNLLRTVLESGSFGLVAVAFIVVFWRLLPRLVEHFINEGRTVREEFLQELRQTRAEFLAALELQRREFRAELKEQSEQGWQRTLELRKMHLTQGAPHAHDS